MWNAPSGFNWRAAGASLAVVGGLTVLGPFVAQTHELAYYGNRRVRHTVYLENPPSPLVVSDTNSTGVWENTFDRINFQAQLAQYRPTALVRSGAQIASATS